jgi:Protein of unknown function (DUF3421).
MKLLTGTLVATLATLPASVAFAQIEWVRTGGGSIPPNAIIAGHEANGAELFACTAPFNGGYHPGMVRPGFNGCHLSYGGVEHTVWDNAVAVGTGGWTMASFGEVPYGAVPAGEEAGGALIFACRAWHNNGLYPGKLRHEFRGCNIAYGGAEITVSHYEVLVQ